MPISFSHSREITRKKSSSITHHDRGSRPSFIRRKRSTARFHPADTAIITRLRIHCGARSTLSLSLSLAARGYIACAIYRIASSNPIRGRGPCNSDLARHGTRFYWQFSIGPHLGYEAMCIANKRSSRVKNNDIVTDHYAAERNDYYRSLLLTSPKCCNSKIFLSLELHSLENLSLRNSFIFSCN